MRKLLAFLFVSIFVLSVSGLAFAAGAKLSDSEMEDINAGDWVTLVDAEGNQTVADVYTTNNTLWLLEDSQKDIQAVSNANAIDSAVAVSTNVARVTGDTPTDNVAVNGTNLADLTNYRPGDMSSSATKTLAATETVIGSTLVNETSNECSLALTQCSESSAYASASAAAGLAYNETLDIVGAFASSSKSIDKSGIGGGDAVGALLVDYDKVILALASCESESGNSSSEHLALFGSQKDTLKTTDSTSTTVKTTNTSDTCTSTRTSKGANNHILLDATSQQSIMAVSNLNAVASGAAVQTNVASNVGVSGSITHLNSATVTSGM